MCYNCGCGDPHDDMGKDANITEEDIQKAAAAMGQSLDESKRNMIELLQKTVKQDKKI